MPILSDCLEHPGNTADLFHTGVSQHHHHMSDLNSKLVLYFILHTSAVLSRYFELTRSSESEMNTKQSHQQAQKTAKDAKLSKPPTDPKQARDQPELIQSCNIHSRCCR